MPYKILIVDDDTVTRDGLASLVADAGYETVAVSDVPAALQVLADQAIDLLITDVRLDSFNGLHLIATAVRPIPSIVVTGFDDPCIKGDARKLGADFLVKPVSWPILRELIERKLSLRRDTALRMREG
jgi:two-component system response regulator PilR (NtrC family)